VTDDANRINEAGRKKSRLVGKASRRTVFRAHSSGLIGPETYNTLQEIIEKAGERVLDKRFDNDLDALGVGAVLYDPNASRARAVLQSLLGSIVDEHYPPYYGCWIDADEFTTSVFDHLRTGSEYDEVSHKILNKVDRAPFLAFDSIDDLLRKPSALVRGDFVRLVRRRPEHGRPTYLSSSLPRKVYQRLAEGDEMPEPYEFQCSDLEMQQLWEMLKGDPILGEYYPFIEVAR